MKLLITADWQTEFANLDLCERAMKETLALAVEEQPDAVCFLGDLKEAYNPIDYRVIRFWVNSIRTLREAGHRVIILQGNHDRISQSRESKNWFGVLRAAGAETVSAPKTKDIGGVYVCFLPFTGDKTEEKEWAKELARLASVASTRNQCRSVLLFHTEVAGALLDNGHPSGGNTAEDLCMDRYSISVGGHFHRHQKFWAGGRDVYYVGSPFAQSWGDANQTKGQMILEVGSDISVTMQHTAIPGWYDTEWLESESMEPEHGAYVRSKLPVTSRKISQQIRDEEARMQRAYPTAKDLRFFVVPVVQAPEKMEVELTGNSDRENIDQYVAYTLQEEARFSAAQASAYLTSKLEVRGGLDGKSLKFIGAEGRDVLCFERVKINYRNQGLVLLRGENKDWPKRSNGSGKTSVLSLLPIALFGRTLKDQVNDGWANERTESKAEVTLKLQDGRGRAIEVIRGRRPHKLLMSIDGKDVSTGLSGKGKTETQGQIEEVTGYDQRMLLNSVYIDQTITNGFVFGTQKDRMDLVAKLQDLARYEAALKLVGLDVKATEKAIIDQKNRLEKLEEEQADLEEQKALYALPKSATQWETRAIAARAEVKRLVDLKASLAGSEQAYKDYQTELDNLEQEHGREVASYTAAIANTKSWERQLASSGNLVKAGKCPTCGQDAKGVGQKGMAEAEKELKEAKEAQEKWRKLCSDSDQKAQALRKRIKSYNDQLEQAGRDLDGQRKILAQAEVAAQEEAKRNQTQKEALQKITDRLKIVDRGIKASNEAIRDSDVHMEMLVYCQKAFHRSGLPMYLSASMCPRLNRAAEEYSEIFTDSKVQISFQVVDGEFTVNIVNPTGSENANGQSVGESAMAGLVAAFALREMAPKTNLLVMDEPGHGLDATGASQFARGILKLKDRFETIIVTTHSPVIESLLAGEKTWVVRKQGGISRLFCGGEK